MTKETSPTRGIYARSDTTIPSIGYVSLQLGNINQVVHSNIVRDPTEINLYAAIMALQSVEDQDVPSQSSRLIPEYVNL